MRDINIINTSLINDTIVLSLFYHIICLKKFSNKWWEIGDSVKSVRCVVVKILGHTSMHPHTLNVVSPWRSCATGPTLDSLARPSHIIRLPSDPTTQAWPSPETGIIGATINTIVRCNLADFANRKIFAFASPNSPLCCASLIAFRLPYLRAQHGRREWSVKTFTCEFSIPSTIDSQFWQSTRSRELSKFWRVNLKFDNREERTAKSLSRLLRRQSRHWRLVKCSLN